MTTATPERIEFNPQNSITNMLIGRNGGRKHQPRHIPYRGPAL